MENLAVKVINVGHPPTIESGTHPATGSWCPGNRPTDSVPVLKSSRLGLFIPKILSSELISIITVYYHSDVLTPSQAPVAVRRPRLRQWLARSETLWAFSFVRVLHKKVARRFIRPRMTT
jgi:hypothetical protein